MKFLLDTCIISELVAKKSNTNVLNWIVAQDEEKLFLSVITIGEISKGINSLPKSKKKAELKDWLNDDLLIRFRDRLYSIDKAVMLIWGEIVARQKEKGKVIPVVDSFIASLTIANDCVLVTRNTKDFECIKGIKLLNPF